MNEDGTRNFWRADEVLFLLELIKKHNVLDKTKHKYQTGEVYRRIERDFKQGGYNRTAIQIRYKFKALKSSFNQAVKESLRTGIEPPSCDFYDELDELFKSFGVDFKCNDSLDSGNQEVDKDQPADLVEILLKEDASQDNEVEMVYYVEKPTQGDLSEGNTSEAIAGNSGLKRSPDTSDSGPPKKKKRKELDGDNLLDKFLDYQKKADERAAKLFREAEERAQDRADARMRESMAILSSTINSIFEKFQSQPNVPYSAHIPPSSVTFNFNPQGQMSASPFFQNTSHNNMNSMHNHNKDHSYSPKS